MTCQRRPVLTEIIDTVRCKPFRQCHHSVQPSSKCTLTSFQYTFQDMTHVTRDSHIQHGEWNVMCTVDMGCKIFRFPAIRIWKALSKGCLICRFHSSMMDNPDEPEDGGTILEKDMFGKLFCFDYWVSAGAVLLSCDYSASSSWLP